MKRADEFMLKYILCICILPLNPISQGLATKVNSWFLWQTKDSVMFSHNVLTKVMSDILTWFLESN